MPIYTKTGDDGITSLTEGRRVLKCDCQVEAYGTVDELSSFIGLVISKLKDIDKKNQLTLIQKDLYLIMSLLAGNNKFADEIGEKIIRLEKSINKMEKNISKINRFVFPQGNEISCWFHVLRTVCRRAERKIVNFLSRKNNIKKSKSVVQYLNRLSDFFFILSRFYNNKEFYI